MAGTQTSQMGHVQKLPKSKSQILAGAFTTTATSMTLNTVLRRIYSASFTMINNGAVAAAETLILSGTVDANGFYVVPANGRLTIGRVGANVTSGLTFTVRFEGY